MPRFNTKLGGDDGPHDDVALVATSHEGSRVWLFYFDCDTSDCWIGCTDDHSVEDVAAYATGLGEGVGCEIDVERFVGWVQF